MKNIWVTGGKGQLGSALMELSEKEGKYNWFFTDIDTLDLLNFLEVRRFIQKNRINVLINCAAYTNVDKAEEEQELALQINSEAVKNLGELAQEFKISLIHISTDYVFDGDSEIPYQESDSTNPKNSYGVSKLKGEEALLSLNLPNTMIIRTAWLYGVAGHNFVKTILKLANEKDEINVVNDQIGSPTFALDLAKTILFCIPNLKNTKPEIYHFANRGQCSWFDFAKEIVRLSKLSCKVKPVSSSEFKSIVKRPKYSLLNTDKIKKEIGIEIPFWKDSLNECFESLNEKVKSKK